MFIIANFINFVKFKTERRRSSQLYIRQNKFIFSSAYFMEQSIKNES